MPIYEYSCRQCKEKFEELVLGKLEEIHCPQCNGTDVEKKVSVCGFTSGGKFSSSVAGTGCSGCDPSSSKCSSCK